MLLVAVGAAYLATGNRTDQVSCELAYGDALILSGTGRGEFACHGDTVLGA